MSAPVNSRERFLWEVGAIVSTDDIDLIGKARSDCMRRGNKTTYIQEDPLGRRVHVWSYPPDMDSHSSLTLWTKIKYYSGYEAMRWARDVAEERRKTRDAILTELSAQTPATFIGLRHKLVRINTLSKELRGTALSMDQNDLAWNKEVGKLFAPIRLICRIAKAILFWWAGVATIRKELNRDAVDFEILQDEPQSITDTNPVKIKAIGTNQILISIEERISLSLSLKENEEPSATFNNFDQNSDTIYSDCLAILRTLVAISKEKQSGVRFVWEGFYSSASNTHLQMPSDSSKTTLKELLLSLGFTEESREVFLYSPNQSNATAQASPSIGDQKDPPR